MAQAVHRPNLDQRFEDAAVGQAQIHSRAEVAERPELATLLAAIDDRLDRAFADILDRQQSKADGLAFDREFDERPVDVRRPDLDPQAPAFGNRGGDLLLVVSEGGQHRGHVLDRVVRLQVRRLVRDQAVAGRVSLVEAVALEGLEGGEDGVDDVGLDAPFGRLGDELLPHLGHELGLLLADGPAESVRLGAREAGECLRRRHDVFLVNEHAVRSIEVRLQQRMEVRDLLAAVLSRDVVGNVVHRARAVERHHGREVEDGGRLELPDVAPHARGLELEDAGRLAFGQQRERLAVVERDSLEIYLLAAVELDQIDGLAKDGQVRQPQEVELEQAQRVDGVHLVLGHDRVGVRGLLERHQLRERLAADDHTGGVGAGVSGNALEMAGEVDHAPDRRLALDHLLELRARLDGFVELDAELVRDRLGDPVALAVGHPDDPGDVPDGGPGEHRAEGDDLGHVIRAVLARHIVDDFLTPPVLEVHVDIRHRHAVRVEEAFERQLVVDGVHRRDAEGIGHDGPGRGAADGDRDVLVAGELGEVGHDQEVTRVAHPADDVELVVEAGLQLRRDRAVASLEAGVALLAQPRLDRLARGHREARDAQLAERQLHVDALGDRAGAADRVQVVREERRHLDGRLEVELVRLEAHPPGRVQVGARAHAQQDVVGVVLVSPDVVQVVGHDEVQIHLAAELCELGVERPLERQTVVLEFQEESILAEDVAVLPGDLAGQVPVVHFERLGDLAAEASGARDQASGIARQDLVVDSGLVVVALEVRVGDEPAEVLVALPALAQQDQMVGLRIRLALFVAHASPGNVRLHSDDRLDAVGGAGLVEGDGAVERAVVGDRHGVESQLTPLLRQLVDPAEAVEQAELGVQMEMDEVIRRDGHGG